MDKFVNDINGGLPLKLNDFRFQDSGYREAFKGLLSSLDPAGASVVILAGCARTVVASTVTISAGFIGINGEVCSVAQHSYAVPSPAHFEFWDIQLSWDSAGLKPFQTGGTNNTYQKRVARVLTAPTLPPGKILFSAAKNFYQIVNSKIDKVELGTITMWSGAINAIPQSYALCDGSNGTPDLRGRFVIGVDPRTVDPLNGIWDGNYTTPGNMGGDKKHSLSLQEIPQHSHNLPIATVAGAPSDPEGLRIASATFGDVSSDPADSFNTPVTSAGMGNAHNNIPPYYTMCFIMKVSTLVPTVI